MLEELAKRDKDWRKMAFQICKDKERADDLVQEMYLKFANYNKELNDFYIFFALRSIFLNEIKKQRFTFVEITNEISDIEEYCIEYDKYQEGVLKTVAELPYLERELLKITQEVSQRKLAIETGIPFRTINETVKNAKIIVKKKWQGKNK